MGQKKPVKPRTKRFHLVSLRKQAEKKGRDWLSYAHEINEQIVTCDGFDSCIIGIANRFGMEPVVAYDYDKCIALLVNRDGMSEEEAVEFFEFNTLGAWVGEGTPVFVSTNPC
jgi:hypothetical protein